MRHKVSMNGGWNTVKLNKTYLAGSLTAEEGERINWHSPSAEHSSQVYCVSAFGTLRNLPDRDVILGLLFAGILSPDERCGPWSLMPEHTARELLGETGLGTPTNVDFFCSSPKAVVCIESKFRVDATEGFGGCGQFSEGACEGFYGPGSDKRTRTDAACRLTVAEGKRDPRLYWELGRKYFLPAVFRPQQKGNECPFAGSNFQLMRNFLFAAQAAADSNRAFGVLCIVPHKKALKCREQVAAFETGVLREEYRALISVATYDTMAAALCVSPHSKSQGLGRFLQERMKTLL